MGLPIISAEIVTRDWRNPKQFQRMSDSILAMQALNPLFNDYTLGAGGTGADVQALFMAMDRGARLAPRVRRIAHVPNSQSKRDDSLAVVKRSFKIGVEAMAMSGDPPRRFKGDDFDDTPEMIGSIVGMRMDLLRTNPIDTRKLGITVVATLRPGEIDYLQQKIDAVPKDVRDFVEVTRVIFQASYRDEDAIAFYREVIKRGLPEMGIDVAVSLLPQRGRISVKEERDGVLYNWLGMPIPQDVLDESKNAENPREWGMARNVRTLQAYDDEGIGRAHLFACEDSDFIFAVVKEAYGDAIFVREAQGPMSMPGNRTVLSACTL